MKAAFVVYFSLLLAGSAFADAPATRKDCATLSADLHLICVLGCSERNEPATVAHYNCRVNCGKARAARKLVCDKIPE